MSFNPLHRCGIITKNVSGTTIEMVSLGNLLRTPSLAVAHSIFTIEVHSEKCERFMR